MPASRLSLYMHRARQPNSLKRIFLAAAAVGALWGAGAPESVAEQPDTPRCDPGCVWINIGCFCGNGTRLTGAVESDEVVPVQEITLPSGESFPS
jgi:hypothetical protein